MRPRAFYAAAACRGLPPRPVIINGDLPTQGLRSLRSVQGCGSLQCPRHPLAPSPSLPRPQVYNVLWRCCCLIVAGRTHPLFHSTALHFASHCRLPSPREDWMRFLSPFLIVVLASSWRRRVVSESVWNLVCGCAIGACAIFLFV